MDPARRHRRRPDPPWAGKVGLVGGCTPTIDRHHAVMGAMGERFVLYRLPDVDADDAGAARRSRHAGRESEMRAELAAAVAGALRRRPDEPPRTRPTTRPTGSSRSPPSSSAARSAVERDGYSREIELIPEPEAPTRLVVVLARLLAGLDAIGVDRAEAWQRRHQGRPRHHARAPPRGPRELHHAGGSLTTSIAVALGYPTPTVRRALEDLAAHAMVRRHKNGTENPTGGHSPTGHTNASAEPFPKSRRIRGTGKIKGGEPPSLPTFRERSRESVSGAYRGHADPMCKRDRGGAPTRPPAGS